MGREGSGGSGRLQHVWLEGSGVWAAVPESREESTKPAAAPASRSGQRHQDSRRGRQRPREEEGDATELSSRQPEPSRAVAAVAPPLAPSLLPTFTGFDLQEDKAASDVEECEPPETCPICLTDIIELGDRAVVQSCQHVFCHACISRWLEKHKRLCPLCKARVTSVLYDITPTGEYKERQVPLSPTLHSIGSGDGAGGADGGPLLARLQEFLGVPGLLDPYERQQHGVHRLRRESGSGRVGYGGRERQRAQQQAQQAQQQAQQVGPRPYFWRLQQRLQAGAYRPGGDGGSWGALHGGDSSAAVSEEDYILLWRRQVYDQDLWAVPLGGEVPRVSLGSGSMRERRLTDWINRELRALLQTDDVTIVRGFVMGLLVAYGIEPLGEGGSASSVAATAGSAAGTATAGAGISARQAAEATAAASRRAAAMVAAAGAGGSGSGGGGGWGGSSGSGSGSGAALRSSPEEALRPFLYEHAEHFWHELRCFATAPFNIATYDRMVQYRRREAPAAAAAAPAAPAALAQARASAGPGSGRRSRWDQRQSELSRTILPARVVASGNCMQPVQQQQRRRQAGDAAVGRPSRGGSRNPSPPPLRLPAALAPSRQLPQQAEVGQELSQAHMRSRSCSGSRQRGRRQRSRSRSSSSRRRRRSSRHSRSGERRRRWHTGRGGSPSRSHWPRGHRSRSVERLSSPGLYLTGVDDAVDRWQME